MVVLLVWLVDWCCYALLELDAGVASVCGGSCVASFSEHLWRCVCERRISACPCRVALVEPFARAHASMLQACTPRHKLSLGGSCKFRCLDSMSAASALFTWDCRAHRQLYAPFLHAS